MNIRIRTMAFTAAVLATCILHAGISTPVERIGWPDRFVEHGKPEILREKHGLTVERALEKALKRLPARQAPAMAG